MGNKCIIQMNEQSGVLNVAIQGIIDEDMDFAPYSLNNYNQIHFKLGGIKGINSCGIREWIKWLSQAKKAQIQFTECPKVIVDQMNMVQGFLPSNAKVQSFFVPYYSDESGQEKNILFNSGKEFTDNGQVQAPTIKDESGQDMEMDVIESKYFKFLKPAG